MIHGFESHSALNNYMFLEEDLKAKVDEFFNMEDIKKKLKESFVKHYVWEEDGQRYSAWEIGKGIMTGDGGYEMFVKALEQHANEILKNGQL
jgi:hypothetical protein